MDDEFFTPLDLAVHATVREFRDGRTGKRGAVALAPLLSIPPGTLSNKANPQLPDARLALSESVPLQLVADDFRILHAYSSALGHCTYRLPSVQCVGDAAILDAYLAVHEATGRKAATITRALDDHVIDAGEMAEIRALFNERVRRGLELLACLERLTP